MAAWEVTSQKYGANALGLQRALGLGSYETAWSWLHKLRRAMVLPDRDLLSGEVEVDESYLDGQVQQCPAALGMCRRACAEVAIAAEDQGHPVTAVRLHAMVPARPAVDNQHPVIAQDAAVDVRPGALCHAARLHRVASKNGALLGRGTREFNGPRGLGVTIIPGGQGVGQVVARGANQALVEHERLRGRRSVRGTCS